MLFDLFRKFILLLLFSVSVYSQDVEFLNLDINERILPLGIKEKYASAEPKVALVLSGGGARAISQIGLLKALHENNIPLEIIVGTSMGSVVGGLYAAGYDIENLIETIKSIDWDNILSVNTTDRNELFIDKKITEDKSILTLRIDGFNLVIPTSLQSGAKASGLLNLLALNSPLQPIDDFDKFLYKFRAVATDLVTGNKIVLSKGSLGQAMRASSSVSLILAPVQIDSMLLVDGGLVANVPVSIAKEFNPDFIIASNTTSPLSNIDELKYPWVIADQSVSIPMKILAEQELQLADFVITPDLGNKKNSDFTEIEYLIEEGYKEGIAVVDELKRKLKEITIFKLGNHNKIFYNVKIDTIGLSNYCDKSFSISTYYDSLSASEIKYMMYNFYLTGCVDSINAEINTSGNYTNIRFNITDNAAINNIKLSGVSKIISFDANSILSQLLNKPFNSERVLDQVLKVLQLYRKKEFLLAKVSELSFDKSSGTLTIIINEGIINKINLIGNAITNDDVIIRELPFKSGDILYYSDLETGLTNLRSLNLFENIDITIHQEEENFRIDINLIEKSTGLFRFGLRLDNEYSTQISLDIRDENLFGSGTEIGWLFSGGLRNRSFIIEHKANRIFNTYLTYKIRAFHEFTDIYTYRQDSSTVYNEFSRSRAGEYRQIFTGASIGIGTQIEKFGNIIIEGTYQNDQIKNKKDYFGETYSTDIFSLKIGFSIDSQNKYPYPTKGFLISSYYETAQQMFGGEVSYTKFLADYKTYLSFNNIHTFSPRVVIGFGDKTLPLSRQFSFGGQNSFIGFREHDFRGRQILISTLEYQYKLPIKIFFDTYFRIRYDLGSSWAVQEEIRFKDLKHGAGFSLSFDTPIGPADFSVGRSFLIKRDLPKSTIVYGEVNFYFTIGYYY